MAWTLLILALLGKFSGLFREGDFEHAVDNSSHPVGLVADWLASAHRWGTYPLAASRRGGRPDHQPRDRSQGCLEKNSFLLQKRKKGTTLEDPRFSLRLCAFAGEIFCLFSQPVRDRC
jgi:hypothetical protein